MEKIWLREYPPGVPAEVDLNEFVSLRDILEKSCRQFADYPAYSNMGMTLRYRDIDRLSRQFGAFLQKMLGLSKGERVAIMMPNVLQYPVALFGALRAGLTVVNVNPLYTARELEHQLIDSGASAVVIVENFAHTLQAVLGKTPVKNVVVTQVGDLLPFPKRTADQFRGQADQEAGSGLGHSRRDPVSAGIGGGRGLDSGRCAAGSSRSGVSAIHRRHHRRRQGRDADPRQ